MPDALFAFAHRDDEISVARRAALFEDQRHHEESAQVLREDKGPRLLSPFVLADACAVLAEKYACRRVLTLRKAIFPQRFRILPT